MHFRMHFRFLSDPHLTQRFLGHQKKRCVNIKTRQTTAQLTLHLAKIETPDGKLHSTPPAVRYEIYIPSTKEERSGGTVD